MAQLLDRVNPLFDQQLTVCMEHNGNKTSQRYVFRILVNTSSNSSPTRYYLELTSEEDSSFLLINDMDEPSFIEFKKQENLTYDHRSFKDNVIDHFRRCLASDIHKDDFSYASQIAPFTPDTQISNLQFYLKLITNDNSQNALLSVIQIAFGAENPVFKLTLTRGTPEMTNSYLGSRLSLNIHQLAESRDEVLQLKEVLSHTAQTKQETKEELDEFRNTHRLELDRIRNENAAAVNVLNRDHQQVVEELKCEHEDRVKKLTDEQHRKISQLSAEIGELHAKNEELHRQKSTLESHKKEVAFKTQSKDSDYDRLEKEATVLRDENKRLSDALHLCEKEIVGLKRDCERKDAEIVAIDKNYKDLQIRMREVEKDLEERKAELKHGKVVYEEQKIKTATARADCKKLEEKLALLDAAIRSLEDQHVRKNEVLKKQEAKVVEAEQRARDLDLQLAESKRVAGDAQIEVKKLTADLDRQEKAMEEMQKDVADKANTVNYLNQQLNSTTLPTGARTMGDQFSSPGGDFNFVNGGRDFIRDSQNITTYANIGSADAFLNKSSSLPFAHSPSYNSHHTPSYSHPAVVTPFSQQSSTSRFTPATNAFLPQENMAPGMITSHRHSSGQISSQQHHLQSEFDHLAAEDVEPRSTSSQPQHPEVRQHHLRGGVKAVSPHVMAVEEPELGDLGDYYKINKVAAQQKQQVHSSRNKASDLSPPAKTARTVTPPQTTGHHVNTKQNSGGDSFRNPASGPQGSLYDYNGRRVVATVTPSSGVRTSSEFRGSAATTSLLFGLDDEQEQRSREQKSREQPTKSFGEKFNHSLRGGDYQITTQSTTQSQYYWQKDSFAK